MSEFDGHLLEYPFISIDRFDKVNLSSTVYFLSHFHKDHIEGLLDQTFLNRLKYGFPDAKLYTSDTTRNLMMSDDDATNLLPYVVGLPVHQQTSISVKHGSEEGASVEDLVVTLISAGHCVGSVMFLYEGCKGTVLYTGDFRLGKDEISKVKCLHSGSQVISLKSVYVDTTFLCPNIPELPSREKTKDCIIDIIKSWIKKGPHFMIHLKCKGKYGYEYIMKAVAKYFQMKIHVNKWRLRMSEKLPDMLNYFTTDVNSSQIHCCYYGKKSTDSYYSLPCGLKHKDGEAIKMLTIIPSSLYFVRKGIPHDYKAWIPSQRLWRVVHSMHASYNEIREVIGYLRAEDIFPFVPPVDCQDIWTAYQRLKDLRASSSESEPTNIMQPIEPDFNNTTWTESLRKEIALSPRSAEHQHKELSISVRQNLKSPPPRRKRRRKDISEEVTASSSKKDGENTFDESDLLYEAFDCKHEKTSRNTAGFPDLDIITEKEEKAPLEKLTSNFNNTTNIDEPLISCSSGQTVNICSSPKNTSNHTKLEFYDLENYSLSKNKEFENVHDENKKCANDCVHPEFISFDTIDNIEASDKQGNSSVVVIISDSDSESTDSDKTLSLIGSSIDSSQELHS